MMKYAMSIYKISTQIVISIFFLLYFLIKHLLICNNIINEIVLCLILRLKIITSNYVVVLWEYIIHTAPIIYIYSNNYGNINNLLKYVHVLNKYMNYSNTIHYSLHWGWATQQFGTNCCYDLHNLVSYIIYLLQNRITIKVLSNE